MGVRFQQKQDCHPTSQEQFPKVQQNVCMCGKSSYFYWFGESHVVCPFVKLSPAPNA